MKQKFFLPILFFLFMFSTAFAKDVTVTGNGLDRQSAIKDAERNAVEQAAGVFVDSRTLVDKSIVAFDEIMTKAHGFVTNINVLEEKSFGTSYQIRAVVSVDTNSNSALATDLQMIMSLNDPRIAVIVFKEGTSQHEEYIENAMTDKLISLNFNHVVDAGIVAGLENAKMLESLYNGRRITSVGSSYGADFVVIGKVNTTSKNISIPDFKGGSLKTQFEQGTAEMTTRIIRLSTGDILETFTVEGKGIHLSNEDAEKDALKEMGREAAEKIEEKFRHLATRSTGVQITAETNDYGKVEKLISDLKNVSGVSGVILREHKNGKAIIFVDTNQSAATLIEMLRSHTNLLIFPHSITSASASLTL